MEFSLEEITALEGVVLIDSSAIHADSNFIRALYDCNEFIHLPPEYLMAVLESFQTTRQAIKNSNVHTTPLASREIGEFLKILNQQVEFHDARALGKQKYHRRDKRISFDLDDEEKRYDQQNRKILRTISNAVFDVCRSLERRNIFAQLSGTQVDTIERLTASLGRIKDFKGVRKDKHKHNDHLMRSKSSLKLLTDEELVATAMVLTEKRPVSIVTRDHHLRNIARRAMRSGLIYGAFPELYASNNLCVFASYSNGGEYTLVYDSDNPQLCEESAEQSHEQGLRILR